MAIRAIVVVASVFAVLGLTMGQAAAMSVSPHKPGSSSQSHNNTGPNRASPGPQRQSPSQQRPSPASPKRPEQRINPHFKINRGPNKATPKKTAPSPGSARPGQNKPRPTSPTTPRSDHNHLLGGGEDEDGDGLVDPPIPDYEHKYPNVHLPSAPGGIAIPGLPGIRVPGLFGEPAPGGTKPARPAKPAQPAKPAEPAKPAAPKPSETPKPSESPKPAESAKPSESPKPAEPAKPKVASRGDAEKILGENAAPEKESGKSKIYGNPGDDAARQRDFARIAEGNTVEEYPNGTKVVHLPDGSDVSMRKSSDSRPTISIQQPSHPDIPDSKYRYGDKQDKP